MAEHDTQREATTAPTGAAATPEAGASAPSVSPGILQRKIQRRAARRSANSGSNASSAGTANQAHDGHGANDAGEAQGAQEAPSASSGTPTSPTGQAASGPGAAHARVHFSPVRASSTPAHFPDRIPPGHSFSVHVTIDGGGPPVTISANTGGLLLNGAATTVLAHSGVVEVTPGPGVQSSSPTVRLLATQDGQQVGQSAPFAVADVPVAVRVADGGTAHDATRLGLVALTSVVADSGVTANLDQVTIRERVQIVSSSGTLHTGGVTQVDAFSNTFLAGPVRDPHYLPFSALTGPGEIVTQQTFELHDGRTGAQGPILRSGFLITKRITQAGPGRLHLYLDKRPAGGTALGVTASAGEGSAHFEQDGPQNG